MNIKRKIMAAVLGVTIFGAASASQAASIFVSSFETPAITGSYLTFTSGTIDGWTVGGNGVDIIKGAHSPLPFPDGVQAIDLNALNYGSLTRTVGTVSGELYSLEFYLSANAANAITAVVGDTVYGPDYFNSTNVEWKKFTISFLAQSNSTLLSFTSTSPSGVGGPTIDKITFSEGLAGAVPLPAAAGVGFAMLGGIGMFAGLRKRLRRQSRIA